MIEKTKSRRIVLNATTSVAQVIIIGAIYFFLYKFLISKIGVKQLGVWSLVVSSTSIANMANFGITSGLVKFIAEYSIKNKVEELKKLIYTALISIIGLFSLFIVIAYVVLYFLIGKIIDKEYINIALAILPYSLCCLFINEVSGVFTSVLEGVQKTYIKNIIYITSSIFFLGITFVIVPIYGLLGVVYAQVFQSIIILITSFCISKKYVVSFSLFKWDWDKKIFKNLISYGSKFQLVSLLQILYEPTTKALLSKFGGLQVVGFYEMASRLISQVRAVINSANQVMIPVVAQAAQNGIHSVRMLYKNTISITLLIAAPTVCAVVVFSMLISSFWLGHYEENFIFPLTLLSLSTFFNVLCGPSYYSSLGEGKLNLLVFVHILMALLNVVLGITLGKFFGGKGVMMAWVFTLSIGSIILILQYQYKIGLKLKHIFSNKDVLLMLVGLFLSFLFAGINNKLVQVPYLSNQYIVTILFLVLQLPVIFSNHHIRTILKRFI